MFGKFVKENTKIPSYKKARPKLRLNLSFTDFVLFLDYEKLITHYSNTV